MKGHSPSIRHCPAPARTFAVLLCVLVTLDRVAAEGLWDAGQRVGGWRSDYPAADYGTAAEPLRFAAECLFPGVDFAFCPTRFVPPASQNDALPRRVFRQANWQHRVVDPTGRFWVVGANSEPALDAHCNSGPPNQSEAIGRPLQDLYGLELAALPGESPALRKAWRLAIDLAFRPQQLAERPDCVTRDFIPYLGVGLISHHDVALAATAPLSRFGPGLAPPELRLRARLEASNADVFAVGEAPPPVPRGQHAGFYVEAQWGGTRRWAWITLFNAFDDGRRSYSAPWNWAIEQSFHFPGADIVVSALPALRRECPEVAWQLPEPAPAAWQDGRVHEVRVDIEALMHCLGPHFQQAPPSDVPVPITGVHVWVEVGLRDVDGRPGFGTADWDSHLAMAFDSLDLVRRGAHPFDSDLAFLRHIWETALGRSASAGELARLTRLAAGGERSRMAALLLRDRIVADSALVALQLQTVVFGSQIDDRLFAAQRADLQAGPWDRAAVAQTLLTHPRVIADRHRLGDAGLLALWYRQALGDQADDAALQQRLVRRFGALPDWQQALARGELGLGEILHRLSLLARHVDQRSQHQQRALLHRALQGEWPAAAEQSRWRSAALSVEQLAEALYFDAEVRRRWWHDGSESSDGPEASDSGTRPSPSINSLLR